MTAKVQTMQQKPCRSSLGLLQLRCEALQTSLLLFLALLNLHVTQCERHDGSTHEPASMYERTSARFVKPSCSATRSCRPPNHRPFILSAQAFATSPFLNLTRSTPAQNDVQHNLFIQSFLPSFLHSCVPLLPPPVQYFNYQAYLRDVPCRS